MLADLLCDSDRESEANAFLRKAAESSEDWQALPDLGFFLLLKKEDVVDSWEALARAVELGADAPGVLRKPKDRRVSSPPFCKSKQLSS